MRKSLAFFALTALVACTAPAPQPSAVADVAARPLTFPNYPQPGNTYLSFSKAHGFQVNYLATGGKAWLWYPGNQRGVPEEYKRDVVAGQQALCWRHPSSSYNPVTRTPGGKFACQSLALSQKTIVAKLAGDPFRLASGKVPYRLNRCKAPKAFRFERAAIGC